LTPTVILQHEADDHAPLGIYRLDRLLAGKIAALDQQMISYLEKLAYYADLILGADWRSRNER
jgi:hypothetical protein